MSVQAQLNQFGVVAQWGGGGPQTQLSEADKQLCDACRNGDEEMAKKALKNNANPHVNFRLALGEITPIFLCASKGHLRIAEILTSEPYKVDIDRKMDFDGTIPLHHAASNDQEEMCEWLVQQGSSPDAKDKLERTPLMDAAEIGSKRCVAVLLPKAKINTQDKEGHTALSYCLDYVTSKDDDKFYEVAQFLVKNGANVNFAGKFSSRTLLHYAASRLDFEYTKKLVEEYKAQINVFDNEGKTPISYAREAPGNEQAKEAVITFLNNQLNQQTSNCCIIL